MTEYHQRLRAQRVELSLDDCWLGYRRYACVGLVMAATAVKLTERGDAMFAVMAERAGQHALDLGAEADADGFT